MFTVTEEKNLIKFNLSSDLSFVDRVIKECMEFISRLEISKADKIKTVTRELLINAIEHGNHSKVEKEIECEIEYLEENRFKITVKDQGDGFDFENLDLRMPDTDDAERSRGLPLVNAFSDELAFEGNGNIVISYISLSQNTDFEITEDDMFKVITPTGDITATCADKFRVILLEMFDSGVTHYKFDFKKVTDIDSISLSLLITFAKMVTKKEPDAQMDIVNVSEDLNNLFNITKLNKIYNISTMRG